MKSGSTQNTAKEIVRATHNISEHFKGNWTYLCTCVHSSLQQEWEESKPITRVVT